jgi:protein subunit release factor B
VSSKKYPRPSEIKIPADELNIKFVKSQGAGGQNVNKLNTKAEIRFNIEDADWLPGAVKERLIEYQKTKVSKDGTLIITSQEHRTQARNKEEAVGKLQAMIAEAYIEPKDRQMWEGIGDVTKMRRRDEKRHRSKVKEGRRSKRDFDD